MKHYFKHFKVLFIILGVELAIFAMIMIGYAIKENANPYVRTNTECLTEERVFDYADVLTDKEEESLRQLIAKREKQTGCDIVLVTLNESLANYAPEYRDAYDQHISPDEYVMVYADKFWEDNKMGFDKPLVLDGTPNGGDGIILVDNWYEEEPYGYKYTWLGTTGKVEVRYSEDMIDYLLDVVYQYVDFSPYQAYKHYINTFYYDMVGVVDAGILRPTVFIVIIALVVSGIYLLVNIVGRAGKKTTNSNTYVVGNVPTFRVRTDTFLRKDVSKVYYNPSSGSGGGGGSHGGGGHHSSGGGGSHGGGGHHR